MPCEIRKQLKKSDLILVQENRYIVHKLKRKTLIVLSVDEVFSDDNKIAGIIPKYEIEYGSITGFEKLDGCELIYLMNQTHPLIIENIKVMIENEK